MMRALLLALVAPLIGAAPAPGARPIAPATFVEWNGSDGTRSFTQGGVTVTLDARPPEGSPVLTVSAAGKAPLRIVVTGDDAFTEFHEHIGIGPLVRGQSPSVLFQSWTGGAHCCERVIAVMPSGNRFVKVDLGKWDGDPIDWPTDLSGDGVVDFPLRDQRFLYAFDCYACSWAPIKVMTIRNYRAVDVSTLAAFRPLYAADLPKAREACLDETKNPINEGYCAGYLATAARLGRFDRAWAEMMKTSTAKTDDFPASVRDFLRKQGYIK